MIALAQIKKMCLLLLAGNLLTACVVQQPAQPGDPKYAPNYEIPRAAPQRTAGSLYQAGLGLALFDDRKARRVGDIITIILSEKTSATKKNSVSTKKEDSIDFLQDAEAGGLGTILGGRLSAGGIDLLTSLDNKRDFSGSGDADQSNSLDGQITVTVAQVHVNGNLSVRGEKWMTLNKGDEYIRISGMIRPDDISPENTIASTKLANARITYSGTGSLAQASDMGWLSRFFNSPIWPF